jgi:hypothetical protein
VHRHDNQRTLTLASDPTYNAKFSIGDHADPCDDPVILKAKAERCRRLAAGISDWQASDVLKGMARTYEEAVDRLNGAKLAG